MAEPTVGEIPSSKQLLQTPQISQILNSESTLDVLLARLKTGILSCEKFSKFLKKKIQLEQHSSMELKKNSTRTIEAIGLFRNTDTLMKNLKFIISLDQEIGKDVYDPYVSSLTKIANDVQSLQDGFKRLRKSIKDEAYKREQDYKDANQAYGKATKRVRDLREELSKIRNGDPSGRRFTRRTRTGAHAEDETASKLRDAELECSRLKDRAEKLIKDLTLIHRPKTNERLKNLILELDSAVSLELEKYATFTEASIMRMGRIVLPVDESKSMMTSAVSIDNEKDLYNHLVSNSKGGRKPASAIGSAPGSRQASASSIEPPVPVISLPVATATPSTPIPTTPSHSSQLRAAEVVPQTALSSAGDDKEIAAMPVYSSLDPASSSPTPQATNANMWGPRPLDPDASTIPASPVPSVGNVSNVSTHTAVPASTNHGSVGTVQGVYGVPLETLCSISQSGVPDFVMICIELLEKYGLTVEGIYRKSANKSKVDSLRDKINANPAQTREILTPADPQNVEDDVYAISTLLKSFFASLPEKLIPAVFKPHLEKLASEPTDEEFVASSQKFVDSLPDPQYFTLEDLLKHLRQVSLLKDRNRMTAMNLGTVWGLNILDYDPSQPEVATSLAKLIEFAPQIYPSVDQ
ncbi:unnamed protein product [Kuraishia capsulata CBS 1993]|uniref:Rho-GAP domain-containing protein n=1 Tax=Kuraishia capsulata CBS 1993 TaxID=1382522 RepID=W6MHU3_9ASCO|nr:uncharacterized protein KUCA_T00001556001 [Kuraishia capsulata CBS 1993]CDK25586.1 unnamed protein product [Kuraishia capsulata CBS 1993]